MKVLIIEDEKFAAENLTLMLGDIDPGIEVEQIIVSVSAAVAYFEKSATVDLVFMDIHLADGISFEIFEKTEVDPPVIFTTAYDEYAIKAFKVNGLDYLLKPLDDGELRDALERFKNRSSEGSKMDQFQEMFRLLQQEKKEYRHTFLVQQRDTLIPIKIEDIAYFVLESGIVKAVAHNKKSYIMDKKMDDIEIELDPDRFFKVNRQYIVHRDAIENMKLYFNRKLIVNLMPTTTEQVIVSKEKAPQLKKWIK